MSHIVMQNHICCPAITRGLFYAVAVLKASVKTLHFDSKSHWKSVEGDPLIHLISLLSVSSILKKTKDTQSKGSVRFGLVTVFLFQRCQGFSSVPSHGGCTLGMVRRHIAHQQFTLAEHTEEQQRLRMERLREQHQEERLEALRQKVSWLFSNIQRQFSLWLVFLQYLLFIAGHQWDSYSVRSSQVDRERRSR